jgi:glycosyltransferase involved in cell wall biosynthesis
VALGALSPSLTAKTVVTVLEPIRDGDIPKGFIEKRLPELLQRAGRAVAGYQTLATELADRYGVARERIEVIAPGVAPSLQPGTRRPPDRDGPVLGFLGRLDADKVWEHVIDALVLVKRQFPAARLWFASSGPLRNLVRAYARGRGVEHEVTFFDDLPPREFLTGIDIVAVPQGRDGLPYSMLQALVDGVPIVATNHEGLADTLGPYDVGWLVPEGAGGLAAGVVDAWPRIDEAWRGAQAQRELAIAAYDPLAVAERYAAMYAELAAHAGEPAGFPRAEDSV